MRRVHEIIVAVEKQLVLHIGLCVHACACVHVGTRTRGCVLRIRAYSLENAARNAYAPYCDVMCGPLGLRYIFRHYLINGAILGKKLFSIKCVF